MPHLTILLQIANKSLSQVEGTSTIGVMIEAMSILYSITGDADIGVRLHQTLASTLDRLGNELGVGSNGVLFNGNTSEDGGNNGDMYLLRGLAEAYKRGKGILPARLHDNPKIILGVHYNAIQDLATTGNNIYSRSWRGPPMSTNFNLYDQAVAAQILVDGVNVFSDNDNPPPNTPPPNTPTTTSKLPKTPAAVITGVTVGSVIFLALIVLITLYAIRQRRRKHQITPSSKFNPAIPILEPFVATISEKRTAFPPKYSGRSRLQAQVAPPESHLWSLRRHNSAPSTFQQATNSSSNDHGLNGALAISLVNTNDAGSRHPRQMLAREETETGLTVPDMVRELYRRLLQPNGLEDPPDYRRDLGGPLQQF
ncbi:hypothetical protein PM082_014413 [Marasmius tenuissimus]|nr:hypothetical protein PM082_014413 [Marasmius tenuissimus]